MSQEFLDAVAAEIGDGDPEAKPAEATEPERETTADDELIVDFEHFPSTVAGLCSCMILVLQALKISAANAKDASQVSYLQRMQVMLRDQAAKAFPKQPWGKV